MMAVVAVDKSSALVTETMSLLSSSVCSGVDRALSSWVGEAVGVRERFSSGEAGKVLPKWAGEVLGQICASEEMTYCFCSPAGLQARSPLLCCW